MLSYPQWHCYCFCMRSVGFIISQRRIELSWRTSTGVWERCSSTPRRSKYSVISQWCTPWKRCGIREWQPTDGTGHTQRRRSLLWYFCNSEFWLPNIVLLSCRCPACFQFPLPAFPTIPAPHIVCVYYILRHTIEAQTTRLCHDRTAPRRRWHPHSLAHCVSPCHPCVAESADERPSADEIYPAGCTPAGKQSICA